MEREVYYNLTRNGDNIEINKEKDKQKRRFDAYTKTNHFADKAGMKDAINLATCSPNVFFSGPHGDLNTIDDESKLLLGGIQTKMKPKLNLQERKYKTIPYLADKKGPKEYIIERKILKGSKWKYPKFKFRTFLKGRKFVANPYKGRPKEVDLELNLQRGEQSNI